LILTLYCISRLFLVNHLGMNNLADVGMLF